MYLETENKPKTETTPKQPSDKPAPIENWENEGGIIIPTGSLPKVVFPDPEPEDDRPNE